MSGYRLGPPTRLYPEHVAGVDQYFQRDIFGPEDPHLPVGTINYDMRGSEMHVGWVEAFGPYGAGSGTGINTLGTGAMRDLGRQLRSEGVTHVSGDRVSGARQDVRERATLSGKNPDASGRSNEVRVAIGGHGGDQPRVPAGSPDGGQFAPRG